MAINYAGQFNRRITPQSQPIPGSAQVPNSAGGYTWQVDDWTRLDRFLILGAEGGHLLRRRTRSGKASQNQLRCARGDNHTRTWGIHQKGRQMGVYTCFRETIASQRGRSQAKSGGHLCVR